MDAFKREQFLLRRIHAFRDERAFKELHDAYVESLAKFLRAKLPTKQDADDALSATLLRMWSYATTTHVDRAAGVLFAIARAVVADFYRSRKDAVSIEGARIDIPDNRSERQAGHATDISILKKYIPRLEEDHQTVVVLRYFQDLSMREIATRMERTEPATRMLLHRALKALRLQFDPTDSHD